MPSSPNYKRDYKQEKKTSDARGEKPKRAARDAARRLMAKKGMVKKGDGKDVDHKVALSEGGAPLAPKNLRVEPAGKNRSFPRRPDGSMIRNVPKKKS
jgi:hypothetical protein